jgi:G3E family GTPase
MNLASFNPSSQRLPVTIITGFLGSGKTTLLNRLLKHPALQNAAVIVNEFGSIGIDNFLITTSSEDLMLVDGGCVCCTMRGDLLQTLLNLLNRREQGEISNFTRIFIETTGLADPAPIIHTLLNEQEIRDKFYLDSVISTIDCVYAEQQFSQFYETVKQAALADRIVLTKTDLAAKNTVITIKQHLQRINPAAVILAAINGDVDVNQLLSAGLYNLQQQSVDVQQWLQAEAYQKQPNSVPTSRHDTHIQAFCLQHEPPLTWKVLNMWLQQITALRGKDLLRIKGLVHTQESSLPIIIQGVQHILQPPSTLPAWPMQPPISQIVFITRNIKQTTLEQMLNILIASRNPIEACQASLLLLE